MLSLFHNRITMEFVRSLYEGPESEVNVYRVDGVLVVIKLYKMVRVARNEQNVLAYLRTLDVVEGIVESYPTGIPRGVASKYYANGELFAFVEAERGLRESVTRRIFRRLAATFGALHAVGVAHRDIKMENLLVDDEMEVIVADFGMAVALEKEEEGVEERVCGTVAYMAPELMAKMRRQHQPQQNDVNAVDLRATDVWSLGCVLFLMVTGNFPTNAFSSPSANDWFMRCIAEERWEGFWMRHGARAMDASNDLKRTIQRCLCADPAQRATAQELCADPWVTAAAASEDVAAYRAEMERVRALIGQR